MPATNRIRVAIVGGGCGGLAAAFELTQPEQAGRYDVTVYQQGWRLGGKGASGRREGRVVPCWRIEEHALHVWLGFYENAFRMLRQCHAELGHPDAWRNDFVEDSFIALARDPSAAMGTPSSATAWATLFPPTPGAPGDPFVGGANPFTMRAYMAQAVRLLRVLLGGLALLEKDEVNGFIDREWAKVDPSLERTEPQVALQRMVETMLRMTRLGMLSGMGALLSATNVLERIVVGIAQAAPGQQYLVADWMEAFAAAVRTQVTSVVRSDPKFAFRWQVIDLVLAIMVGMLRDGLLTDPRGLDAINHLECREWLRRHGASADSLTGPFVTGLYNLSFADHAQLGAPGGPGVAAGQALRGALRMFFTYRGAMFWKMRAGMGDVVFAPLYEVLKRRGVRFEFFHRLENVGIDFTVRGPFVTSLEFAVQARVSAAGYEPLVQLGGRACWPAVPNDAHIDKVPLGADLSFESFYDRRRVDQLTCNAGADFDFVVLAIGKGAIASVCGELVNAAHPVGERWKRMVDRVPTVPTQAFQVWLREDMQSLGWHDQSVTLAGIAGHFDTWSDMRQVVPAELWPPGTEPSGVAYFCGPLRADPADFDPPPDKTNDAHHPRARHEEVRGNAIRFLDAHMTRLWRNAGAPGDFRWGVLLQEASALDVASLAHPIETQYLAANINPSDQYVLAPPGSIEHRISPLDSGVCNLTVAGDWTACGFTEGCVEAAVMSGRLASHAISQLPRLEDIVGYDHP